jgi:hypothetical protein
MYVLHRILPFAQVNRWQLIASDAGIEVIYPSVHELSLGQTMVKHVVFFETKGKNNHVIHRFKGRSLVFGEGLSERYLHDVRLHDLDVVRVIAEDFTQTGFTDLHQLLWIMMTFNNGR